MEEIHKQSPDNVNPGILIMSCSSEISLAIFEITDVPIARDMTTLSNGDIPGINAVVNALNNIVFSCMYGLYFL